MEKEKLEKKIINCGSRLLTGLLGSPVSHSMSPFLHNAAFEQLGMKGYKYITIEADERFLPDAVPILKKHNFIGFNLTMPDKELMVKLCDKVSREAKLMSSVNTVKIEGGKLVGYNTDCYGFFEALDYNDCEFKGRSMVLLGAGGAARAILAGAAFCDVGSVEVFARPSEKYDILCELVQRLREREYSTVIRVNDLSDRELLYETVCKTDILVNATNVGMEQGKKEDDSDVRPETLIEDTTCFHPDLFVADVIYFPRMTKLLKDAEAAGCRYMNGLGMLFFQASLAFEIWHEKKMPMEIFGDF